MIGITINGKHRELADNTTVQQMLADVGVTQAYVAVALNGAVVPRAKHKEQPLKNGDNLEIVHPAGGGL